MGSSRWPLRVGRGVPACRLRLERRAWDDAPLVVFARALG